MNEHTVGDTEELPVPVALIEQAIGTRGRAARDVASPMPWPFIATAEGPAPPVGSTGASAVDPTRSTHVEVER